MFLSVSDVSFFRICKYLQRYVKILQICTYPQRVAKILQICTDSQRLKTWVDTRLSFQICEFFTSTIFACHLISPRTNLGYHICSQVVKQWLPRVKLLENSPLYKFTHVHFNPTFNAVSRVLEVYNATCKSSRRTFVFTTTLYRFGKYIDPQSRKCHPNIIC